MQGGNFYHPKEHQQNTTKGYQRSTIQDNKGMLMSKKGQKGTNKTQYVGVDKHQCNVARG
jgi:hypothetical protein